MGQIDQVTNAYMSDKAHFADIFNYHIFNGEPVLSPDTLCEKDTTELVLPYGHSGDPERIRRVRDVFKYACAMEDEQKRAFILLGIEDQSHVHYAAPVKDLLYDAISYANQVDEISSAHRGAKDHTSKDEFLSGFHRDDQILPVITLMLYWSDKEWDGPLTLHEMMDLKDKRLARFVVNYKVNLISPSIKRSSRVPRP